MKHAPRPMGLIPVCVRATHLLIASSVVAILAFCHDAANAQIGTDPGATGRPGGRHGSHRANPAARSNTALEEPRATPIPWPRLEAGALLCPTETALRQHQAAIAARLDGREAPEPTGCRLMPRMTAITVVERHGPASTEVRLTGTSSDVGWTDAVIANSKPP